MITAQGDYYDSTYSGDGDWTDQWNQQQGSGGDGGGGGMMSKVNRKRPAPHGGTLAKRRCGATVQRKTPVKLEDCWRECTTPVRD